MKVNLLTIALFMFDVERWCCVIADLDNSEPRNKPEFFELSPDPAPDTLRKAATIKKFGWQIPFPPDYVGFYELWWIVQPTVNQFNNLVYHIPCFHASFFALKLFVDVLSSSSFSKLHALAWRCRKCAFLSWHFFCLWYNVCICRLGYVNFDISVNGPNQSIYMGCADAENHRHCENRLAFTSWNRVVNPNRDLESFWRCTWHPKYR